MDVAQGIARVIWCGMQVERLDGLQHMHIPPGQTYKSPGEAYVEGDASSASYFLAGACGRQCLFTRDLAPTMQAGPRPGRVPVHWTAHLRLAALRV